MKLLIIGFTQAGHMGTYLASAARQLGVEHQMVNAGSAEARSRLGRSFYWHLRGKRPARLGQFGAHVLDMSARTRPSVVLTTGHAPLDRTHIEILRGRGIRVVNYSTDDPWNPALRAPWFLSAVSSSDVVFTTRRANIGDFLGCGVRAVHYLSFSSDSFVLRPGPKTNPAGITSDVLFVARCDADRLPLIGALIYAVLNVALFGGYWNRHSNTRP